MVFQLIAVNLLALILILGPLPGCFADGELQSDECITTEKLIRDHIFENYSKFSRPVANARQPIVIYVGLRVFGISDFNERENMLVLDGYIIMQWTDVSLIWNETFPLNCTDHIVADVNEIWQPDLSLINAPGNVYTFLNSGLRALVNSSGEVTLVPTGEIAVHCELDLTLFPFDEQTCSVRIESWNYPNISQQVLLNENPVIEMDQYWTDSQLWDFTANLSQVVQKAYGDEFFYDTVIFTLRLRRKSLFYYVNVITPSLIISICELVTFVLPIQEVIKIHISFTCLLAYSVFQSMVIVDLPKSSLAIPLLTLYIDLQMAYIGIIALLGEGVVFMLLRRSELQVPPPLWLYRLAHNVGRVLCVDAKIAFLASHHLKSSNEVSALSKLIANYPAALLVGGSSHGETSNGGVSTVAEQLGISAVSNGRVTERQLSNVRSTIVKRKDSITEEMRRRHHRHQQELSDDDIKEQWIYMAEVVERFNMFLYVAAICLTPAIMFTALRPKDLEMIEK